MVAELRRRGHEDRDIFEDCELSWERLTEDERFVSFEQLRRIVDRGLALTGEPWLGCDVGRTTPMSSHGALGFAVVASPDVGTALDLMAEYSAQRIEVVRPQLVETESHVLLELHDTVGWGAYTEYVSGHVLGAFSLVFEGLTGGRLQGAKLLWPFPPPAWSERYVERLPGWLHAFGARVAAIELPCAIRNMNCILADRLAFAQAMRSVQAASAPRGSTLRVRVVEALLGCEGAYPRLDEMASTLGLSSRTLVRRLSDEGESYQALLDEVRKEEALWFLRETRLSVEEIATQLGYRDPSNFSRTCKRWFGRTPRELRNATQPPRLSESTMPAKRARAGPGRDDAKNK